MSENGTHGSCKHRRRHHQLLGEGGGFSSHPREVIYTKSRMSQSMSACYGRGLQNVSQIAWSPVHSNAQKPDDAEKSNAQGRMFETEQGRNMTNAEELLLPKTSNEAIQ